MVKRALDGNGMILGNPNETGIIGAATVGAEVPIFDGREMRDAPVKKQELRTQPVNVEGDIVLLGDGRALAIIEEPDCMRRLRDTGQSDWPIAKSGIVHMLV